MSAYTHNFVPLLLNQLQSTENFVSQPEQSVVVVPFVVDVPLVVDVPSLEVEVTTDYAQEHVELVLDDESLVLGLSAVVVSQHAISHRQSFCLELHVPTALELDLSEEFD